jgi:RNA polymerase sigma-70 factor, ECF subfamily
MILPQKKLRSCEDSKAVSEISDEDLIRRAVLDRSAFGDLYKRHVEKVYRYFIFKVGNSQDAQELTSQTFLAALESLPKYRGTGSFTAWLFGIARHKSSLFFHNNKSYPSELAEDVADPDPLLEDAIEHALEVSRVSAALNMLKTEKAEAIRLYFISGLSAAEAAEVLGKSEPAVRMLLHRGIQELKQRLEQGEAK